MHVLHTFANNDHVPYLTWFVQRAKGVTDLRYSFVILFPTRPSMIDEMEALGHTCIWIRYDDAHRKRDMLLALPQMWRHIRRLRPDVVHTHLFDDAVPGTIAAWMARIKVRVTTKQDTGYHWMYARKWMFLDRLVTRLSTHIQPSILNGLQAERHGHRSAVIGELYAVRQGAHEENAATMRLFDIERVGRVGKVLEIEARTLVLDHEDDAIILHLIAQGHVLGRIESIAMMNGVVHRLGKGDEDVAIMALVHVVLRAGLIDQFFGKCDILRFGGEVYALCELQLFGQGSHGRFQGRSKVPK